MPPTVLTKGVLVASACCIGLVALADSEPNDNATDVDVVDATTVAILTEAADARFVDVGQPDDAESSAYAAWTNAQINEELNQIHLLSPQERRDLLLEVSHRIERFGHFEVDKHEQRFGHVVSSESDETEAESQEPRLEEFVIARTETSDKDVDAPRVKEVRKQRQPVRRVSSGRAYSSQ